MSPQDSSIPSSMQPPPSPSIPIDPALSEPPLDPALLSVSLEFFAFPGYAALPATANCLANLANLRGAQPAIRIGGTTQCVFLLSQRGKRLMV